VYSPGSSAGFAAVAFGLAAFGLPATGAAGLAAAGFDGVVVCPEAKAAKTAITAPVQIVLLESTIYRQFKLEVFPSCEFSSS
jgi:hypothetical protein